MTINLAAVLFLIDGLALCGDDVGCRLTVVSFAERPCETLTCRIEGGLALAAFKLAVREDGDD